MTLVSVGMSLSVKWRSFWSDLLVHSMVFTSFSDWKFTESEFANIVGVMTKFLMHW